MITITIDTGNDAFEGYGFDLELDMILDNIKKIVTEMDKGETRNIRDTNGNRVGQIRVE